MSKILSQQTQELTYLSKTNICQTILLVQEAQLYLQEEYAKDFFKHTTEKEFLKQTKLAYQENSIINKVVKTLETFANGLDVGIASVKALLKNHNAETITQALGNCFGASLVAVRVDIENFKNPKSKIALQEHYKDLRSCYKQIGYIFTNTKL